MKESRLGVFISVIVLVISVLAELFLYEDDIIRAVFSVGLDMEMRMII